MFKLLKADTKLAQTGLYFVKGLIYVAYSLWRTIVEPLQYFNAPEPFGLLAIVFFITMFVIGAYFIVRSTTFLKHGKESNAKDLVISVCSIPFWLFPAYFALGIVLPFLSVSSDPAVEGSYLQFLLTGILFCVVGAVDIAAIVIAFLRKRAKSSTAHPKDKKPRPSSTVREKKIK